MDVMYTGLSEHHLQAKFSTLGERMKLRSHEKHAVAVVIVFNNCVVGHLPREYSRITWHFLQHGVKITCQITGRRWRGLGLVVPCNMKATQFQNYELMHNAGPNLVHTVFTFSALTLSSSNWCSFKLTIFCEINVTIEQGPCKVC